MSKFDVIVIGGGAAGFMAAIEAAKRRRSVLLIDSCSKVLEKVRISGGARCNFTNLGASAENYISANPHFCKSALAQYPSESFIKLVESYDISYNEKKLGQLFCNNGSGEIINMLHSEAKIHGVKLSYPTRVLSLKQSSEGFALNTSSGDFSCASLIIASGGLSIPLMGASPFAYEIARQFGINVLEPRPALVPLTGSGLDELAGLSMDARVSCGKTSFRENVLFTHRGLSGPAILQISSYWQNGLPISVDLCPEFSVIDLLLASKHKRENPLSKYLAEKKDWPKLQLKTLLRTISLPVQDKDKLKDKINREHILAEKYLSYLTKQHDLSKVLAEYPDKELETIAKAINNWQITPSGTEGYAKAEVTAGGIDTRELDSKTMMAKKIPGLYFIGECVDVTGWLGGYNLQWAWASGHVAGQSA
jgi:predicted Rossmann fold flavoprotein